MRKKIKLLVLFVCSAGLLISCDKEISTPSDPLQQLYKENINGEISECNIQGFKVYLTYIGAYDGGAILYNEFGVRLGGCNSPWTFSDPICGYLESCEVIYRGENNIWGRPAKDKYNLNKN